MGIAVILTIWAGFLIFKDRNDWFKYVIVLLAAGFLAGTPVGQDVIRIVGEGATWVDHTVGGLFQK